MSVDEVPITISAKTAESDTNDDDFVKVPQSEYEVKTLRVV